MRIPDDLIPFAVIGLGAAMLVVIVLIHGYGINHVVSRYKRRADSLRKAFCHPTLAVFVFAGTILLMLLLHLTEIFLWGLVLHWGGLIRNLHESVYFSANTYTTLGMGPMALPHIWHELSPIIAISGLFTFAWTTSEMFNIVGDQHELVAELSAKRKTNTSSQS